MLTLLAGSQPVWQKYGYPARVTQPPSVDAAALRLVRDGAPKPTGASLRRAETRLPPRKAATSSRKGTHA